jgi:hypothetical protein
VLLKPFEPLRLIEYRSRKAPFRGRLFTCARPGRSLGAKLSPIDDAIVKAWVDGLPTLRPLYIVSLLGSKPKPSGISEYSFYSFRGGHEPRDQRPASITFQKWLDLHFGRGSFIVVDFPTTDTEAIDVSYLSTICEAVRSLLDASANVLIVDSGGVGRSGKVCASLRAKPLS